MAPGARLEELTAKYMQNPRRYFVPLANEYRKTNELDRAIALCREHLPSQPGHMSGHIVLGRAYFEKGDIDAAREVFLTSVALDDENLIALRHLGDIARSRNDAVEARQWYARVLDADPENAEIERLLRSLGQEAAHETALAPAAEPPPLFVVAEPPTGAVLQATEVEDPTPPGLRAITARGVDSSITQVPVELPPVPVRPLNTLDLSTLDSAMAPDESSLAGIRVDDGVGFIFDELDQLTDPTAAGAETGASLPPVNEADFSAGIATPTMPGTAVNDAKADPLLSRPGFGALASFASWRTAQDRDTPSQQSTQRATPDQPPAAVGRDASATARSDAELFAVDDSPDAATTAPEFVTETMAALYAQQGFTQQALDVYRALLARAPGSSVLATKVAELEVALADVGLDKSLRDDADKALQFDELEAPGDNRVDGASILEDMYRVSPPTSDVAAADASFGGGWSADADRDAAADDWFADEAKVETSPESEGGFDGFFGVPAEGFGRSAVPSLGRGTAGSAGNPSAAASPLATVFGATTVTAADEAAGDLLLALAAQMVGRLPKEAPTLPVPDILELPSAIPGDAASGAAGAPLLSFDRFFSGSGSPPRQRLDSPGGVPVQTPARPSPTPATPSLLPTFGGVPVIPPPPASVTPSSWATFDQFVPPASAPVPVPSVPPVLVPPPVVPPATAPSVRPLTRPVPVRPDALPPVKPVAYASFTGLPSELTAPAPTIEPNAPPAAPSAPSSDAVAPTAPEPPSSEPSDFHKWLEGLS